MENFGLGLVLNFQDNASSRIDSVLGLLENLQRATDQVSNSAQGSIAHINGMSDALTTLGAGLTALGGAGVAAFAGFTKKVMDMGSSFEQNITALTQLYGDANVAQQKFLAFEQMSAATPLGMQAIQSAATRLKTVGIEAEKTFDVMVDGEKKARPILEIFGDLAAIRPDKGLDTVIRESIEFIEGNARPLKMSFGLDPKSKDSIGEQLADTAEGRADQLVRIIEKAGYTGMLDKTNDQWNTIMQNLGDNFNLLMYYVSIGSGLFEEIKKPFKDLFQLLRGIVGEQDDMKVIGGAIANGLRVVIAPVMALLFGFNKLVALLAQFTKEHPKIVSMGIAFVGIASQITLMTGVGIVALGVFMKMRSAYALAIRGARTLTRVLGIARLSFGLLLRSILPVTIALGFLYYAWTTNFLGLRTIVGGTLQYLSDLFTVLADAMTHIDTDKGIFSLSKKNYDLAEKMGILPLLRTFATLYHYATMFWEGMKEGAREAQETIERVSARVDEFLKSFEGTPLQGFSEDIQRVKQDLTTTFSSQTAEDVKSLGAAFGEFAVYAGIIAGAFTVLKPVFSVIGTFISIITTVGSAIGSVLSGIIRFIPTIISGFGTVLSVIGTIVTAVLGFFGIVVTLPAWLVGAITVAVVAIIGLVYAYWDEIVAFFSELGEAIVEWFNSAYESVMEFLSEIGESLSEFFNPIIEAVSPFIEYIATVGELIYERLRLAFWTVYGVVANFVGDAITALGGFVDGAQTVFNRFTEFVAGIFVSILSYVLTEFVAPAVVAFSVLYAEALEVFNEILAVITEIFTECYNWVMETFINPIVNEFTYVYNQAVEVFGTAETFINGVFDSIERTATRVLEAIRNKISDILDGLGKVGDLLPSLPSLSDLRERVGLAREAADQAEAKAKKNALGGIYNNPVLTWVAEAGYPEAIIPLDGSDRGMSLWEQAGKMLGVLPTSSEAVPVPTAPVPLGAIPVPVPSPASQSSQTPASAEGGITFEAGSIQFHVTTDNFDAEKAAQMIIPIIKRKLEIARMTSRQGGVFA